MSATGRADVRHADDFYATPAWATQAILPYLNLSGNILEPCAGEGAILAELVRAGVPLERLAATELDPTRALTCQERIGLYCGVDDLLAPHYTGFGADLIISNPPYVIAEQIIRAAVTNVTSEGEVAMLLRVNILASRKRVAFWRKHPAHVFVLPIRPSFSKVVRDVLQCSHCKRKWKVLQGAGPLAIPVDDQCECGELPVFKKTVTTTHDACEYGWFVFGPKRERRWDVLELPKEVVAAEPGGGKNGLRRARNRRVRGQLQEATG
jgi:hypothetical protein